MTIEQFRERGLTADAWNRAAFLCLAPDRFSAARFRQAQTTVPVRDPPVAVRIQPQGRRGRGEGARVVDLPQGQCQESNRIEDLEPTGRELVDQRLCDKGMEQATDDLAARSEPMRKGLMCHGYGGTQRRATRAREVVEFQRQAPT